MRIDRHDPFEIAAALALVSLLSVLACAALGSPTRSARAELLRISLDGLFAQASRHAASQGHTVILCPVDGNFSCTGGSDWSRGWIAFADRDGDQRLSEGDDLLRRDLPLPDGTRLCDLAGRTHIRFTAHSGRISGGGFVLCDLRCPREGVALRLSDAGRVRLEAATPGAAERCSLQ